jgi:3,4-dihydroxy-2-butanone 4-phosphate synthase
MEHRGVQYQIVQTANPTGFKWTVHIDASRTRTGVSATMKSAIIDAQRKIDKALMAKKAE